MNKIKIISMFLFCILSIFLVIKGQNVKGYTGLLIMLIGLTGLLVELYLYNKKYV